MAPGRPAMAVGHWRRANPHPAAVPPSLIGGWIAEAVRGGADPWADRGSCAWPPIGLPFGGSLDWDQLRRHVGTRTADSCRARQIPPLSRGHLLRVLCRPVRDGLMPGGARPDADAGRGVGYRCRPRRRPQARPSGAASAAVRGRPGGTRPSCQPVRLAISGRRSESIRWAELPRRRERPLGRRRRRAALEHGPAAPAGDPHEVRLLHPGAERHMRIRVASRGHRRRPARGNLRFTVFTIRG